MSAVSLSVSGFVMVVQAKMSQHIFSSSVPTPSAPLPPSSLKAGPWDLVLRTQGSQDLVLFLELYITHLSHSLRNRERV